MKRPKKKSAFPLFLDDGTVVVENIKVRGKLRKHKNTIGGWPVPKGNFTTLKILNFHGKNKVQIKQKRSTLNKWTKKPLTINDFVKLITWSQIEDKMGKRDYKKFCNWMAGQTVMEGGVYPHDLENYLQGGENWD